MQTIGCIKHYEVRVCSDKCVPHALQHLECRPTLLLFGRFVFSLSQFLFLFRNTDGFYYSHNWFGFIYSPYFNMVIFLYISAILSAEQLWKSGFLLYGILAELC